MSAGQRQRIGLARALYGDPFLVVLDEPNSNLDSEGDEALTRAILGVRARGGIVIVIAHRPSALAGVDTLLVMQAGRMAAFGPKETVLKQALRPAPSRSPAPVPTPVAICRGSARHDPATIDSSGISLARRRRGGRCWWAASAAGRRRPSSRAR